MNAALPSRVRRLLRRAVRPPTTVRGFVAVMALVATLVTTIAVVRISRRHQVITLGYQLSRSAERLRHARELHRRLELERATLTAPGRIEELATKLGMTAAPPDQIRVVPDHPAIARVEVRR